MNEWICILVNQLLTCLLPSWNRFLAKKISPLCKSIGNCKFFFRKIETSAIKMIEKNNFFLWHTKYILFLVSFFSWRGGKKLGISSQVKIWLELKSNYVFFHEPYFFLQPKQFWLPLYLKMWNTSEIKIFWKILFKWDLDKKYAFFSLKKKYY